MWNACICGDVLGACVFGLVCCGGCIGGYLVYVCMSQVFGDVSGWCIYICVFGSVCLYVCVCVVCVLDVVCLYVCVCVWSTIYWVIYSSGIFLGPSCILESSL